VKSNMIVRQRALQWMDQWIPTNIVSADIERYRAYNTGLGVLYEGDCLELLRLIRSETIDTAFADPPFNLGKNYGSRVTDELPDDKYIKWSKEWLRECVRLLKLCGAISVYNLLKWNIILENHLTESGLVCRNWISVSIRLSLPVPGRLCSAQYNLTRTSRNQIEY
jgi:site-specific DNA-methyltransferase (adenine-specific)